MFYINNKRINMKNTDVEARFDEDTKNHTMEIIRNSRWN